MSELLMNILSRILLLLLMIAPLPAWAGSPVNPSRLNQSHFSGFEENKGQVRNATDGSAASDVKFILNRGDLQVFLFNEGISWQFNHRIFPEGYKPARKFETYEEQMTREELEKQIKTETYRMDMRLAGCNPDPGISVHDTSSDYVNYYNHQALGVRSYELVIFHDVYPNIDFILSARKDEIKYSFLVHPGADPNLVKMRFEYQDSVILNADGSLSLYCPMGVIHDGVPEAFNEDDSVPVRFHLRENELKFEVNDWDRTRPLLLDPSVHWFTYYGGDISEQMNEIQYVAPNMLYATGQSASTFNIAYGGHQLTIGGLTDAMLVKFDTAGTRIWATYFGGPGNETGASCRIDAGGNIFLAGQTSSQVNMMLSGHQMAFGGGSTDAYVAKFNSSGTLLWATYLGGSGVDYGYDVETDASGNAYLTGTTNSTNNIAFNGFQNTPNTGMEGFISKFSSTGSMLWSSYWGGPGIDYIYTCSWESAGNIWLGGYSSSTSGIVSGGFQGVNAGSYDGIIASINASTGIMNASTYLGDLSTDQIHDIHVVSSNEFYVCGTTWSTGTLLGTNGYQNTSGGGTDAFLAKFHSIDSLEWSTYFGGTSSDQGQSCSTDYSGNIFLGGYTNSSSGIAVNAYQYTLGGTLDGFLARFSPNGLLDWATYFGGNSTDYIFSVECDPANNLYSAGQTFSSFGFPAGNHQTVNGGGTDGFMVKMGACVNRVGYLSVVACGAYDLNGQTYTSSGNYTQVIPGIQNCDSTIYLSLVLLSNSASTLNVAHCGNYSLNGQVYFASGTYTQTLSNSIGCDSVITLNLTQLQNETVLNVTACESYNLNGFVYFVSGTYQQMFTNASGCDSLVILNLTIDQVAAGVIQNGNTLTATQAGATYQWIDCTHGGIPVANGNAQSYTAVTPASYAVVVTLGACTDTSACFPVGITSDGDSFADKVNVFPNPANDFLYIHFSGNFSPTRFSLIDLTGKAIRTGILSQPESQISLEKISAGVYFLKLEQDPVSVWKIIKN